MLSFGNNRLLFQTRYLPVIGSLLTLLYLAQPLSAEIVVLRMYHGKRVACAYSGLIGTAKSCGTQGYERVFTGTVRSSVELGETDKRLEIEPDEVFVGGSKPVTAITNQACLDTEIRTGDKWLFYLYRDNSNTLVLPYASASGPVTDSDDELSMLRDLVRFADAGTLRGRVSIIEGVRQKDKTVPLANHEVLAKSVKTGASYVANTNQKEYFRFVLPPDVYDITTASEYGFRVVEEVGFGSMLSGSVPVKNGECWEHNFVVERKAEQTQH